VPSYSHGAASWTWTPASDEDVALVDRLTAAWTTHDVDAVPSLYAPEAQLVMSWMADPAPYDVIRATIAGNGNSYQRISPVFTVAGEGSAALPGGSRYLFFALVIHDDIFDSWLEVNARNLILTHWAGWAK
jgi:hypothetical protein